MLATFTVREDISEEFEIEDFCFPVELFRYLQEGLFHAFRVDLIDNRFQVTISGDNQDDLYAFLITYADGPDSVEYHIAN